MNINNPDLRRLPPTEQLRHHVRRGDHRAAIHLALELHDDETARRSAWRAIQSGATWSCVDEAGEAMPLIDRGDCSSWVHRRTSWLDQRVDSHRAIVVEGSTVPALWDEQRALLFAEGCSQNMSDIFEAAYPDDAASLPAVLTVEGYAHELVGREQARDLLEATIHSSKARSHGERVAWAGAHAAMWGATWVAKGVDAEDATDRELDVIRLNAQVEHIADELDPLMLRHMLLSLDELTTTSLEVEGAR